MLYCSGRPVEQDEESLKQASLLIQFKKSLPADVLWSPYLHPQDFAKKFRPDLTRHVMQVWKASNQPFDAVHFPEAGLKLGLVRSSQDVVRTNTEIVSEAEEVFFATGSRSRDEGYLRAIEQRLRDVPRLVHHRVLMGPPYRGLLKEHLRRLLDLRSPADRSQGFKTLYLALFEKPQQQAEVFITGNEKRVLVVLPSRRGLGEYNNALVIDDPTYVNDLYHFVKQMYAASRLIETADAVDGLAPLLG